MSVNQRIEELEKYYKSKGITFYRYININSQTIKNITGDRKSNPSHKILEAILLADSTVNIKWLILGQGEMILKSPSIDESTQSDLLKRVGELEEKEKARVKIIEELSKNIEELGQWFDSLSKE